MVLDERERAMLAAMETVATLVREKRAAVAPVSTGHMVAALDHVASLVRTHAAPMAAKLLAEARNRRERARLHPVDPRDLTWNPFRVFGAVHREIRWTQWFSAMLKPENGELAADVTWRALCSVVAEAARDAPPRGAALASATTWEQMASLPPTTVRHEAASRHGRTDIEALGDGYVLVIENKLGADWHDGSSIGQATSYERRGRELREQHDADYLGLVLLTCRGDMAHPDEWVRVTWAALMRSLRAELESAFAADASMARVLSLMPVLLAIQAMEGDVLGLDSEVPLADRAPAAQLAMVVEHLRNVRGEADA